MDETNALVPAGHKLPKKVNVAGLTKSRAIGAGGTVGYITKDEVVAIIEALGEISRPKYKERNMLLVKVTFDAGLRCSEAIGLRPMDLYSDSDGSVIRLVGKGSKYRESAISPSIANELHAFAYNTGVSKQGLFFPISRRRAHQMVAEAIEHAGIRKPDGVGSFHVLRHSSAIERLRVTGNPRALQHQLGHSSGEMTMRYLKTLERAQSMEIQKAVELW